jgi:hypothetical protein
MIVAAYGYKLPVESQQYHEDYVAADINCRCSISNNRFCIEQMHDLIPRPVLNGRKN